MLGSTWRIGVAAFACTIATLALPAAAPAAPEPCGGAYLIKDAEGDAAYAPLGPALFPAPANADVIGVFFRMDGETVTANLAISDLTASIPQGFQGIRYRVYWLLGNTEHYVEAQMSSSGVTYTYGRWSGAFYTKDGDTTGALFEGKAGVVQIVIPPDVGGTPDTQLDATTGTIGLLTTTSAPPEAQQLPPVLFSVDTAPDAVDNGPSTTPADCGGPPSGDRGSPRPPSSSTPPRVTLARAALSARKSNQKRSVALVLRSGEGLRRVKVQLKRGSKVLGTATMAKAGSSTPFKVRLKKKLTAGTHQLVLTGERADGSPFTITLKLRVTR